MTSVPTIPRPGRAWLAAPLGVALALTVAACTASQAAGPATTAPTARATTGTQAGAQGQPPGGGVSGTIAYLSGALMQVQDADSQTAVTWTAGTTITAQVAAALADVTPGVCVVATTTTSAAAGGSTATTPATGTAATTPATGVVVSDAVDGACGAGSFGAFPGGAAPSDLPTDGAMPTGMPTGMPGDGTVPTAFPSGGAMPAGFGGRSGGLVTAVAAGSITVQSTAQDGSMSSTSIAVDGATTYTRTTTADASALVVGQCVLARGDADSSGKVTATSLAVSAPVGGSCTSGFGQGGMRGQGAPGGQRGQGTSTAAAGAATHG